MSEEEKDAAAGDPAKSSENDAPIALPETTPPPPAQPYTPPMGGPSAPHHTPPTGGPSAPHHTPPMGVPQGYAPPGSYAMGALGGNPRLGSDQGTPPHGGPYAGPYGGPYGSPYGGPYAGPGGSGWLPPSTPASTGRGGHRMRTAVMVGAAGLIALGLGVGIGHLTWGTPTSNFSAAPSSGSGSAGSGQSPFGNNPFGNGFPGNNSGGGSSNSGNSGSSNSSGSSGPSDVNSIAAKIDPGLVDINTTLGYSSEQAAGTGIVLTSNGTVLTNNHVINGATSISVTDVGNNKTYSATVVGYDRTHDIAVLALHNASGLQTASISNASTASVGEDVVGVGNAGGTGGTPSAAGGTVTALNQSITASDEGDGTSEQLTGLIQTNANIQPGDSGGALVNGSGQVIGVDTAASAGYSFQYNNGQSQGAEGFAIPINTALGIAHQIENGQASATVHIGTTAFLGVEISSQNSSSGNSGSGSGGSGNGGGDLGPFGGFFGNSGNNGSSGSSAPNVPGAVIAGTVTNGPAQEAGLAQGDVITSLGGKPISSANDLTQAMTAHHPGDKVSVGWTDSNGNTHTATVQLSSGPPQ